MYFLISNDSNYNQLYLNNKDDEFYISSIIGSLSNNPKKIKANWIDDEDEELQIPDITFVNSFIPVFSENAYNVVKDSECIQGNEFFTIDVESETWYVLNICTCYENILNLKKSKISKYDDGSISWIFDFVFKKEIANESLFYLKEQPVSYFCTKTFVQLLKDNNIKGLNFIECKTQKYIF